MRSCQRVVQMLVLCVEIAAWSLATARAAVGPELAIDQYAPIVHQKYFRGERELFGYDPFFTPNTVTFDAFNVPYIAVGIEAGKDVIHPSDTATDGVVQTLDANGNWLRLSYADDIRAKYLSWNGLYKAGTEKIVFDDAGDAYMLSNHTRSSNLGRQLLLYSTDRARSWQIYELPSLGIGYGAVLESPDGQHRLSGPPTISLAGYGDNHLTLVQPTKTADGRLSIGPGRAIVPNTIYPQARLGFGVQGGSNSTATIGNLTHMVYMSMDPIPGTPGTPQYLVTRDSTTGQTSAPLLLGVNGIGAPDVHNKPAIAVDSQGYLHALLGGHHNQFLYTKSLEPNSATGGWTTPTPIGKPKHPTTGGGYTYVSMAFDQEDTLHVVGRYAGDSYKFNLDYLRKPAGEAWQDRGHLVVPFRQFYSTWNQTLTVDEIGRLFLRYSYYGDQFDYEGGPEVNAYRMKWPEDEIRLAAGSRPMNGNWLGQKHHDPVVLMSDTGGLTWRLATTPDFINGFLADPIPGDFNGDWIVDATDLDVWKSAFGLTASGDADGDGDADGADFLTWQRSLGNLAERNSITTVPEPTTGPLLAIGLVVLSLNKRGRRREESSGKSMIATGHAGRFN
jgi:hypothetical protein